MYFVAQNLKMITNQSKLSECLKAWIIRILLQVYIFGFKPPKKNEKNVIFFQNCHFAWV
jgi:hypothetical protein